MAVANSPAPVLIDLESDTLVPVTELAKRRLGRRIPPASVWRWVRKGCRGVKLEAVHVRGIWHSTDAAFADFIRRQTAAVLGERPQPQDAADDALTAAGVL